MSVCGCAGVCGGVGGGARRLLLISAADALFQARFLPFAPKFGAEDEQRGCASSSSPVRSLQRPTSGHKGTFKRPFEAL